MKTDIAIDTTFIIIIAIISVFVILDIVYTKFFANSQLYYCKTLISEGGFSPSCIKYYPSAISIIFTNQTEDEIISDISGFIINCYYNNIDKNTLFNICYDIYIDENISLNLTNITNYLENYSTFNINNLEFHLKNNDEIIYPYNSLFIIYNNSNIILWQ
ncbi:MAG: hypothetical protein ACP5GJ_00990 [Nanopusillaceae archaeon]